MALRVAVILTGNNGVPVGAYGQPAFCLANFPALPNSQTRLYNFEGDEATGRWVLSAERISAAQFSARYLNEVHLAPNGRMTAAQIADARFRGTVRQLGVEGTAPNMMGVVAYQGLIRRALFARWDDEGVRCTTRTKRRGTRQR